MKSMKPTPTLHDVASKSGVSTATVSRCLNFPGQVALKTRNRVMAAVLELGYSPNFGAKAMATRRTNTIGAIIPTMENAIFARGLQAFQEELRSNGYTLLVASSSYKAEQEEEQIHSLVARGADGLLLIGHERDNRVYEFLDAQSIPVLVTWALDKTIKRPSVGFDNRAAMRELAREVIRQGHRNLAVISAEVLTNDRARERVLGIREAMAEAGMNGARLPIIETQYGIANGAEAFEALMNGPIRPTAILCGNDVLAVGALRRAREMNIPVPAEVSITGFDDIELAQVAVPALTTVHVPHREMGRTAARMLVRMVQGKGMAETIELQADLRLRETLAPPKHNSPTNAGTE